MRNNDRLLFFFDQNKLLRFEDTLLRVSQNELFAKYFDSTLRHTHFLSICGWRSIPDPSGSNDHTRAIKNPGAIKEHLKSVFGREADMGPANWVGEWGVGWEAWDSTRGREGSPTSQPSPPAAAAAAARTKRLSERPQRPPMLDRVTDTFADTDTLYTHTLTYWHAKLFIIIFFFFAAAAVKAFCLLPFRLLSTTTGIGSPAAATAAALAAFCCFAVFGAWLQLQFSVFCFQFLSLQLLLLPVLRLGPTPHSSSQSNEVVCGYVRLVWGWARKSCCVPAPKEEKIALDWWAARAPRNILFIPKDIVSLAIHIYLSIYRT